MGILWYPIQSKMLSSFWCIVLYIRNTILLGSTTKRSTTQVAMDGGFYFLDHPRGLGRRSLGFRVQGVGPRVIGYGFRV